MLFHVLYLRIDKRKRLGAKNSVFHVTLIEIASQKFATLIKAPIATIADDLNKASQYILISSSKSCFSNVVCCKL